MKTVRLNALRAWGISLVLLGVCCGKRAEATTYQYDILPDNSYFHVNVFGPYKQISSTDSDSLQLSITGGNVVIDDVSGLVTFNLDFTTIDGLRLEDPNFNPQSSNSSFFEIIPDGTQGSIVSASTGHNVIVDPNTGNLIVYSDSPDEVFEGAFVFDNGETFTLTAQEGGTGCTVGTCAANESQDYFNSELGIPIGSVGFPIAFGISAMGNGVFNLIMQEWFTSDAFLADNGQMALNLVATPEPATALLTLLSLPLLGMRKRLR